PIRRVDPGATEVRQHQLRLRAEEPTVVGHTASSRSLVVITFSTRPGVAAAPAITGASSSARSTRVTWYGSSNCSTLTSLYGTESAFAHSRTVEPRFGLASSSAIAATS